MLWRSNAMAMILKSEKNTEYEWTSIYVNIWINEYCTNAPFKNYVYLFIQKVIHGFVTFSKNIHQWSHPDVMILWSNKSFKHHQFYKFVYLERDNIQQNYLVSNPLSHMFLITKTQMAQKDVRITITLSPIYLDAANSFFQFSLIQ